MNAGKIDQVADPVRLYTKPQTRFVAAFIGRTNLLDGVLDGGDIRFPGVHRPGRAAPGTLDRHPSFSVRPQSIGLHRAAPSEPAAAGG